MEGPETFHRFVVVEFPTFEQAVACFNSPGYQAAAAFRRKDGAGEVENVIVAGGEAAPRGAGSPIAEGKAVPFLRPMP